MPLVSPPQHRASPLFRLAARVRARLRLPEGLRPRLVLLPLVLLLSATLPVSLWQGLQAQDRAVDAQLLRAQLYAQAVGLQLPPALHPDAAGGLQRAVAATRGEPELRQLDWVDATGHIRARVAREPSGRVRPADPGTTRLQPPLSALVSDDVRPVPAWAHQGPPALAVWLPLRAGEQDREPGYLRLEFDPAPLRAAAWQAGLEALLAGLALAGLLGALQWRLLGRLTRQLARVQAFSTQFVLQEPTRLSLPEASTELRQLADALNIAALRLTQHRETIDTAIEELMRNEEALNDSNDQLQAIFALSPDGLLSLDSEGRVRYVNEAFARLFGIGRDELLGRDLPVLDALLHARISPRTPWTGLAAAFTAAQAPEGAATQGQAIELDGPPARSLHLNAVSSEGAQVHRLLHLRDVTEQAALDRLKSEFLSTAAHELRTPLASVYAYTELLVTREFPPERQKEFLRKAYRQTGAVILILNELLDLARIEARGGQDFQLSSVDLGDLIERTIGDFSRPADRDAPRWQRPEGPCVARVDADKLRQVLGNLLSNAYKYSPDGGPVDVRLARLPASEGQAACFQIEIEDTGIGMTPEQLSRVCERFYRADTSGKIPGTGLGMAIVREIVELLGGSLHLSSSPGLGTRVQCRLRVDPAASVRDLRPQPDAAAPPAAQFFTATNPSPVTLAP